MKNSYLSIALVLITTGCSSYDFEQNISAVNGNSEVVFAGEVIAAKDIDEQNALKERAKTLLQNQIGEAEAVELMLTKSPAFQELLFNNLREGSLAAQTGRIPNPAFAFERMVKGSETEYGRFLTFGLLDLASLPSRQKSSKIAVEIATVNLESEIFSSIMEVRFAWLDAVAAEQRFSIAEDTFVALSASAEMAKRMKQTGNMTTSDRIRQQLLYSEATIALAKAKQTKITKRERLIRLIGLNDDEADTFSLPDSLPDVPETPALMEEITRNFENRFDVTLARLDYELALARTGVENVSSYTDIEIGLRNDRINDDGSISNKKGYEIEIQIPLFDWGNLQRDAMQAEVLSKQQNYKQVLLSAVSDIRSAYNAYRTSFDIAQHYQNQIIPMHETLLEEATYNYNGMIIGVFELLEAGREKSLAETNGIEANHNLLVSELNLKNVALGKPANVETGAISATKIKKKKGH